ncbi:MAG: putative metal-binding motif-containing protein [Myxococcota bacterium]|nr:putative metal-binding motif-containing protein [Myxococcota bacterium]
MRLSCVLIVALSACSEAACPAGTTRGTAGACELVPGDANGMREDAGAPDAAADDAGLEDAGSSDAGILDADILDADILDADTLDACVTSVFWRDGDGDGFGRESESVEACAAPAGYASESGDCDDATATTYPGATEACNGADDDCDGEIDQGLLLTFFRDADGDGYGVPSMTQQACVVPSGYAANDDDCDDACASCSPVGTEVCDGLDNDCDGTPDDGLLTTWYRDCDGDGHAASAAGAMSACATPASSPTCSAWTSRAPTPPDCSDSSSLRYPGNPGWYTAPVGSSYDYDCSGIAERRYTEVGGGCSVSGGTCTRRRGWTTATAPACGMPGTWLEDCAPVTCVPFTSSRTQECH